MKIEKAVIAAAGNGTRFLPVTKAYAKELIPVLNKPIIQYLVEELIGAGIKKICVIHRPNDSSIKRYFFADNSFKKSLADNGKLHLISDLEKIQKANLGWHFLPQSGSYSYGTGAPVLSAQKFIGADPFVYFYGDDLILEKKPGRFLSSLIKTFVHFKPKAVLGVQEAPWNEVARYGSVRFKKDGLVPYQIESVEEGLPAGRAPSNFVQFGRFVVSPYVLEVLKKQRARIAAAGSSRPELLFTDAVKTLAKKELVIAQPIKSGRWLTTGDPDRWLKANLAFKEFFKK